MGGERQRVRVPVREHRAVRSACVIGLAVRVIAGYKALQLASSLGIHEGDPVVALNRYHQRSAERIFATAIRLGGLMIKIGQALGSNPAAFPLPYVTVLSRLQDAAPPRPWAVMRPRLEAALGAPVTEAFAAFDRRPVAAASLAQVYRARLHDGRSVAVKVLYPGIERLVRSDLGVLKFLLWLDSRVGGYPLESFYEELARNVPLEVDLLHEGDAMTAMAAQFADDARIVIPRVIWEHTSRTVLVMQWVDGVKLTDRAGLAAAGIDRQRLADLLFDCYGRQLLVAGHFQADPHPGNLFALPGDRLAIVDFGLTKRLTPVFRQSVAKLLRAMITADPARMVEAFAELGFVVRRGDDHQVLLATGDFFRSITDPRTYGADVEAMQALNETWARAVRANPFIAIPSDIALVTRVFGLLTGTITAMGAIAPVAETVLRYTADASADTSATPGMSGFGR